MRVGGNNKSNMFLNAANTNGGVSIMQITLAGVRTTGFGPLKSYQPTVMEKNYRIKEKESKGKATNNNRNKWMSLS